MPIDFQNPQLNFRPTNLIYQAVQKQARYKNPQYDVFIKNVEVKNNIPNNNFEGMTITKKNFGSLKNGEEAFLYTIKNKNGASVDFSTFGATITSIKIPDKNGNFIDVVQGYDSVTPYETAPVGHAGGTIGPVANKIYEGKFYLNGKTYQLETNKDNGKTHCHGASQGFDLKNWTPHILKDGIEFTYLKKDMEGGYPGNVLTKVTYKFDNENNLHIIYSAVSDKDTLINMTNHTYFNLDGAENTQENSVYNHIVKLPNSSFITENDEMSIPTGKILSTKDTPFDFSKPKKISDVINSESKQLEIGSGYDHNYVVDNYDGRKLIEIADIQSEKTGINLKVSTNLPGFQFYTANHLGKKAQPNGKNGTRYEKRSSLCVEPQFFPNAINTKEFKDKGILKKGEQYKKEIIYSFSLN